MAANSWLVSGSWILRWLISEKPALDPGAKAEPAQFIDRISFDILSLKPKTEEAGEEKSN
jgi:hypothetical protein